MSIENISRILKNFLNYLKKIMRPKRPENTDKHLVLGRNIYVNIRRRKIFKFKDNHNLLW